MPTEIGEKRVIMGETGVASAVIGILQNGALRWCGHIA
jgi:hypothetical protein